MKSPSLTLLLSSLLVVAPLAVEARGGGGGGHSSSGSSHGGSHSSSGGHSSGGSHSGGHSSGDAARESTGGHSGHGERTKSSDHSAGSHPTKSTESTSKPSPTKCTTCARDGKGRIARSEVAKRDFMKETGSRKVVLAMSSIMSFRSARGGEIIRRTCNGRRLLKPRRRTRSSGDDASSKESGLYPNLAISVERAKKCGEWRWAASRIRRTAPPTVTAWRLG